MVNKQPFVNGHILVCPTRKVARFQDLTELELIEMWMAAQEISEKFRNEFGWEMFQYVIQDGKDAGQTVDHVHMHIIPQNDGLTGVENEKRRHLERTDMDSLARKYREILSTQKE